ncbi:hypothetical protein ACHQM5_012997 [Ranunculus cassubicifolius]
MGKKKYFILFLIFMILSTGFSSVSASPPKIINGVLSKTFSTLLKWVWSLIGSTKTVITGRPVLKYEEGYIVETVFDGSKLGIVPYSVEVLPSGEIMVLDSAHSNLYTISTPFSRYSRPKLIAGSAEGYSGYVDGKLREARLNHPKGVAVDDRGNIYIADAMNNAIRKISEAGVTTIAGGKWGRGGRGDGQSEDAKLSNDFDLVYVGSSCSLLVIDRGNQAIREIQLQYSDCGNQYDTGFPLGVVVLISSVFVGYMLAFLQRRASRTKSSQYDTTTRKQVKEEEGLLLSLLRLIQNIATFLSEMIGGKQKPLMQKMNHNYRNHSKHQNGWPLQDSFVIPDEDEPPSVEATTPTPKKTYSFMANDPKKIDLIRQSRVHYNGLDGDAQKQGQQKEHLYQQHFSSGSQTFYEQPCELTSKTVQVKYDHPHPELIKRLNYED